MTPNQEFALRMKEKLIEQYHRTIAAEIDSITTGRGARRKFSDTGRLKRLKLELAVIYDEYIGLLYETDGEAKPEMVYGACSNCNYRGPEFLSDSDVGVVCPVCGHRGSVTKGVAGV